MLLDSGQYPDRKMYLKTFFDHNYTRFAAKLMTPIVWSLVFKSIRMKSKLYDAALPKAFGPVLLKPMQRHFRI